MKASYFLHLFYVSIFSATFAIVPMLLLAYRSSGPQLGSSIILSINTTCDLLPISLSSVIEGDADIPSEGPNSDDPGKEKPYGLKQDSLVTQLRSLVSGLMPIYSSYALEIVHAPLPATSLVPLIKGLQRIHRNPLLGSTSHVPGERIRTALKRSYDIPRSRESSMPGSLRKSTVIDPSESAPPRASTGSSGARPFPTFPVDLIIPLSLRYKPYLFSSKRKRTQSAISTASAVDSKLKDTCHRLVQAISQALRVSASDLSAAYGWAVVPSTLPLHGTLSLLEAKDHLELVLTEMQMSLTTILDLSNPINGNQVPSGMPPKDSAFSDLAVEIALDRDRFRLAFYMTALLDLAKDVLNLLFIVMDITAKASPSKHWILPAVVWPWTRGTELPETVVPDGEGATGERWS